LWLAQLQQNKRVKAVLVGVGIVAVGLSIGSLLVSISLYNTNLARFLLSLNPNNAIFHINLGFVLHNEGKLDEAMFHYQEAIRLNPKNAVAYYNLGLALKNKGQFKEAIFYYIIKRGFVSLLNFPVLTRV